ncbi:hypothetical protein TIFTF001_031643 [Ficus carica]|uniref:Uncharacterized protein n=1 Tax=Ficus carica TaxID=3494 RepID=A0AA88DVS3_FICCA|nr:hypothetical protein TIFTF001_031643 [Ficus carica]
MALIPLSVRLADQWGSSPNCMEFEIKKDFRGYDMPKISLSPQGETGILLCKCWLLPASLPWRARTYFRVSQFPIDERATLK